MSVTDTVARHHIRPSVYSLPRSTHLCVQFTSFHPPVCTLYLVPPTCVYTLPRSTYLCVQFTSFHLPVCTVYLVPPTWQLLAPRGLRWEWGSRCWSGQEGHRSLWTCSHSHHSCTRPWTCSRVSRLPSTQPVRGWNTDSITWPTLPYIDI